MYNKVIFIYTDGSKKLNYSAYSQNVITLKYGATDGISANDGFVTDIKNKILNTAIYTRFDGYSQAGQEGCYLGYRHNNNAEGFLISRARIIYFYATISSSDVTMSFRTIVNS